LGKNGRFILFVVPVDSLGIKHSKYQRYTKEIESCVVITVIK
jgi:hypothetical protein